MEVNGIIIGIMVTQPLAAMVGLVVITTVNNNLDLVVATIVDLPFGNCCYLGFTGGYDKPFDGLYHSSNNNDKSGINRLNRNGTTGIGSPMTTISTISPIIGGGISSASINYDKQRHCNKLHLSDKYNNNNRKEQEIQSQQRINHHEQKQVNIYYHLNIKIYKIGKNTNGKDNSSYLNYQINFLILCH